MSLATPSDVAIRLGRELTETETGQIVALLSDAETVLTLKIPDLLEKAEDDPLFYDLVVMVETRMLARVLRNPEGYTQESDGNYSYSIDSRVGSGVLSVFSDEWALLGLQTGAFIIETSLSTPITRADPEYWYGWRNV